MSLAIAPNITSDMRKEIDKQYINNTKGYITKFIKKAEIQVFRKKIEKLVFQGLRHKSIQAIIEKEYDLTKGDAEFLAQNEACFFLSVYKSAKYQDSGIEEFEWRHTDLSKEPNLYHKNELNGKVFRFDDLPIIDQTTGERGLPGQLPGCRCEARPVVPDTFWR